MTAPDPTSHDPASHDPTVVDLAGRPVQRPLLELLGRRLRGEYPVDEWGLDPDLVGLVLRLGRWRYDLEVLDGQRFPATGPALLVHNRRFGCSETAVLSLALWTATRRVARVPGVPDRAPVGPVLRRVGGVLDRPDEVAGLLRAGQPVALGLGREPLASRHAGAVAAHRFSGAVAAAAPIVPVAVVGDEWSRRWRVSVGTPIAAPRHRDPLAVDEVADRARDAVQRLLD